MVYKVITALMAVVVILTGCTTTPAATPTVPAKATATTAPKPAVASPTAKPAASPATSPKAAVPSGTLNVAISNFGFDNLDPVPGGGQTQVLYYPIFETLIAWSDKGATVPRLAESWSISADGKTWTFKLRKGVKFHNGDEMTSEDVKFSIERFMSSTSRSYYAPNFRKTVDRMETPDPYTLVIHAKDVDAPFPATGPGLFVMPKKYFEAKGEAEFAKNPVGTGPFKFVKHDPGKSVEYEAVPNHWRITPVFKNVVVKNVPEESTRIAMLKRGEIDITEISLDNSDDLKKAGFEFRYGTYDIQAGEVFSGNWLASDMPVSDIKVRQALSLGVNRQELAQTFFKGFGEPSVRQGVGPYSWGYDPSWKPDPYDPAKAKQLLAEAGYPGKFKDAVVNLWSFQAPGAGWVPQFVQIVSGYWEAVGLKTKITPIDYATLQAMLAANPIDAKIPGSARPHPGATIPNNMYLLVNAYHSTGLGKALSDPAWDTLYANTLRELDENKRIAMWREIMNKGHDQYVDLMAVNVKVVYAVSSKVGEWTAITTNIGGVYEGVQAK